ncbi:hypothetical protein V6N11_059622 [Hibiscus sabdariffa]|uniref:SecA family profile domain-containing protein n=1 Tax=Hibiscus sabdariffa TaxID=183260 RepID=A0ABR2NXU8_9ROSI
MGVSASIGGLLGGIFKGNDTGESTRQENAGTVTAINRLEELKEAFAVVREASKRVLGLGPSDVQLIARRDCEWVGQVPRFLGLKGPAQDEVIAKLRSMFLEIVKEYKAYTEEEWKQVMAAGGLHVVGTERHESQRIDNQLRGRSGRQGDPEVLAFFQVLKITSFNFLEGIEFSGKWKTTFLDIHKQLFEYDEVLNSQRDRVYTERRRALMSDNLLSLIIEHAELTMDDILERRDMVEKQEEGLMKEAERLLILGSKSKWNLLFIHHGMAWHLMFTGFSSQNLAVPTSDGKKDKEDGPDKVVRNGRSSNQKADAAGAGESSLSVASPQAKCNIFATDYVIVLKSSSLYEIHVLHL